MKLPTNIFTVSFEELADFIEHIKEKKFRTKQIWEWLWKKNIISFDEMTNLPISLKSQLNNYFSFLTFKPLCKKESIDGTIKYTLLTENNMIFESVLIPDRKKERITGCISVQSGCNVGCKFCSSAMFGYKGDLSNADIISQIMFLRYESFKNFNHPLSNIVVMGMGEPFLNYTNTIEALKTFISKDKANFSPSRITISTVGIPEKIKLFAEEMTKINLAISLHSADETIRSKIIPISKKYPLKDLIESLKFFYRKTNQRITIEYVLLKDINDNIRDAEKLLQFCKNFPIKINLINYNPGINKNYEPSPKDKVLQFYKFLKNKNLVVNIRQSKGSDIEAACGQLAAKINNIYNF